VAVPLDGIQYNTDQGRIALFEAGPGQKEVPAQLETGPQARLWFLFDHSGTEKSYIIRRVEGNSAPRGAVAIRQTEQGTTISRQEKPVMTYVHAEVFPPEGVDAKFRRSAFIHPLWSPEGEVLSRIQPPDHYHHYGIWNPFIRDRGPLNSGATLMQFRGRFTPDSPFCRSMSSSQSADAKKWP